MRLYTDQTVVKCSGALREFDALTDVDFGSECFWSNIPVYTGPGYLPEITGPVFTGDASLDFTSITFEIFSCERDQAENIDPVTNRLTPHTQNTWKYFLQQRRGFATFRPAFDIPNAFEYTRWNDDGTVVTEKPYADLEGFFADPTLSGDGLTTELNFYTFSEIFTWTTDAGCNDTCGKRCPIGCADIDPINVCNFNAIGLPIGFADFRLCSS